MEGPEAGEGLATYDRRVAVPRSGATLTLAVALLIGTPWSSAAAAAPRTMEPGVLTVCLYAGFAPFSSKDADGRFIGWDVDYLNAFAVSQGLRMAPVEVTDYSGIWDRPAGGACDVAASGISDTAGRRASSGSDVSWTQHYYSVLRAFLVRSTDADRLNGIDDLRGRTVVVTRDSTADQDLRNRLAQQGITSTTITLTSDERDAARQVRDAGVVGEPFAYGGGLGSVQFLAAELGGLAVAWPHCTMREDGSQVQEPFSFVVRAADTGLLEALNRFIDDPAHPYGGQPTTDPTCAP